MDYLVPTYTTGAPRTNAASGSRCVRADVGDVDDVGDDAAVSRVELLTNLQPKPKASEEGSVLRLPAALEQVESSVSPQG